MTECVPIQAFLCAYLSTALGEYPTGHLQPFGHHRPPTVPVDEFTQGNFPRPEEFYKKYVRPSKPAIFRNAVTESNAYQLWTDEYIRNNFGEMEVRLEAKSETKTVSPVGEKYLGRDNLRHFVDTYHAENNNVYIVSDLPAVMFPDVKVIPSFGACGVMSRRIIEVDIWWSGGGSYSIIHKDDYNQLNCLLNGTKYWKLIDGSKYEKDLYKHPEPDYELGGFSDVNPAAVNLIEHPNVKNIEWSNFTLNAGDCLFLPYNHYHQIYSVGTNNKAVSLLFSRLNKQDSPDFSDCTDSTDYSRLRALSDFNVQWPWQGHGIMVMGGIDLEESIRDLLLKYVTQARDDGKKFNLGFLETSLVGTIQDYKIPGDINKTQIFNDIDRDGGGIITRDEVKQMNFESLRNIVLQLDRYEPSNHYEFEYSNMAFEKVWALAKVYLDRYKKLSKDVWLQHYRDAGGSNLFGEEVFNRLAGDKEHIISAEITDEILYASLENWVKYFAIQYSILDAPPTDLSMRHQWFKLGMKELVEDKMIEVKSKDERKVGGSAGKDEL